MVAAYLGGTTSGALVTALAAWALSGFTEPLSGSARLALLTAGATVVWLVKYGPLDRFVALPEARRQIPAVVFGGNLTRGAYRFGFELATGVRTYLPAAAPYVLALVILLARPTLLQAVLIGLGFGLGRALPLVVRLVDSRGAGAGPFLRHDRALTQAAAAAVVLIGGLSLV